MSETDPFLHELLSTPSPSGSEDEIVEKWADRVSDVAEVETDHYGNTVATLNPGEDFCVGIACHLDEIGYMVRHIDDDGYIYLQAVGGVDESVARGQRVTVHTDDGPVTGVMGGKSIHLLVQDENRTVPKLEDIWVDVGADDRAEAEEAGVRVGDPVTFSVTTDELQGSKLTARALDNRAGAWAVAEALRELADSDLDVTVKAVATVQQEVGMVGSRILSGDLGLDAVVVTDVTFATGSPPIREEKHGEVELGGGPVRRHGKENHPALVDALGEAADERGIEVQNEPLGIRGPKELMDYETTDADKFVNGGQPTAFLGIPCRYIHTPSELVDVDDLRATRDLLVGVAERLSPADLER